MGNNNLIIIASIFAAGVFATAAVAHQQTHHQHGAHVHGQVKMSIAAVGGELLIEWHTPAGDVFGFEHPLQSPQQTDKIEQELAWLESGGWIDSEALRACELQQVTVHTDLLNDAHTGHADVEVLMHWQCAQNVSLNGLKVSLFDRYQKLESIHFDWLNETEAGSGVLTTPDQQIRL